MDKEIRILIKQCARWAVAAHQDKSPLIALLHANYAAGYLWAILDIATPQQIEKSTGINFFRFKSEIQHIQAIATKKVSAKCPMFAPKNPPYLIQLSGQK